MSQYDPAILETFADKMYARATNITLTWAFLGLVIGGTAGAVVYGVSQSQVRHLAVAFETWCVCAGLLGAVVGFLVGLEKAFWIKLEAQKVLCLLQTEVNTRPIAAVNWAGAAQRPEAPPGKEGPPSA